MTDSREVRLLIPDGINSGAAANPDTWHLTPET